MRLQTPLALLATGAIVSAAPQRYGGQNAQQPFLPDLSTDDFETIQAAFKIPFEGTSERPSPPGNARFGQDEEDTVSIPSPFPRHPPAPVIDFSHLTILEIVNASLVHHHKHEHDGFAPTVIDEHDPAHLPLHKLAWLVNFSSDAQEYLQKDDITLLAPDDQALTPPRRRGGHGPDHHHHGGPRDAHKDDELSREHVPHVFHSEHLSPESLRELASEDNDGDDKDDKEKERRREIFRKIISYVGKYHVVPGRRQAHDLADSSTLATLLDDSRINVRPGLDWRPFPHPTIRFNVYVEKRGPTILAKNGVIHLVSGPLAPPFGPLNELFIFPQFFSSMTSDLQKVGLDEALAAPHAHQDTSDLEYAAVAEDLVDELVKEKGLEEYTVFAPSNLAYARVPTGILAGLHLPYPFAKKVLKYILAGHVVPNTVFFSDFYKNDTGSSSVHRFATSHETDVEVPLEWIHESPPPAREFGPKSFKTKEWRIPGFPGRPRDRDERGPPPPPPRGPRGERPPPPPKGPRGERPHPPHEHPGPGCRGNITHYELPTLLTADNANATLKVAVVSYRPGPGGKGPIKRSVVVFPVRPHHHEHDHDHHHEHERGPSDATFCPGRRDPFAPIKAVFADFPARAGAIHVLPRIIPPPLPPHHDSEHDKHSLNGLASEYERKKLRDALDRIFF
ncbi:uncharacterized protein JCM15063_006481 [Sporobolomyces koalae]|uniref:uncharacterized protein n=1 Tax=Sporobolomyces koalae TaxID=500713 RepID=UPI003170E391